MPQKKKQGKGNKEKLIVRIFLKLNSNRIICLHIKILIAVKWDPMGNLSRLIYFKTVRQLAALIFRVN